MAEIFTAAFWAKYGDLLLENTWDTLVMVVISTVFAFSSPLRICLALSTTFVGIPASFATLTP